MISLNMASALPRPVLCHAAAEGGVYPEASEARGEGVVENITATKELSEGIPPAKRLTEQLEGIDKVL